MITHALPGFQLLETHHCITGSLRHIYEYHSHPLSEDLLLGVGGGVGFIYWHTQGALPFLGGRANSRGEFEPLVGARTGVGITVQRTASARKAESVLGELLAAGQPVMLMVDMGFLPYFDFGGSEYHFGGHAVVAYGGDAAGHILLADREGIPHPVTPEQLAQARGSTYKPFPPQNAWFTFDFSGKRQPTAAEVRQAIAEQAAGMLHPPITNLGVSGIRKAAKQIVRWPAVLEGDMVRGALFNSYIMIDATGGTGGGLFRYMMARFLKEAAALTAEPRYAEIAAAMHANGDVWQEIAALFKAGAQAPDPGAGLAPIAARLREVADMEEAVWQQLAAL